ncbi:ribonuclease P protein component [Alicyclobacillus cycloheptanicus]|uniref:Ribonuclease P protein component n=1 Tax=Alicyclobacillus cycloheptanicus TaxID=1457 RepID=A0ABT9XMM8_9BACL|nr:ribonuclease P protein component [Alicyclobacillus cycloheptanicus]MDQ0190951.1 ribonuclease P protein component [Alicyclobacillus cycloheptanicus]WDM02399.1 ribonuclease P protein component [Alicyclobacillus cycloheptanicus]
MQSQHRLKQNRDFRRVFHRGKSAATPRLVLYWMERRGAGFRAGFSVSKKVGNAVTRNLMKRRLRACFDEFQGALADVPVDFVVVCRPAASEATYQELLADLVKLLRKGKFMV